MNQEQRPPDNPTNLFEWLWRLKHYEDGIFIRHQVNGKWDSVSLSSLDSKSWAKRVAEWLEDGSLPVRVREEEELSHEPTDRNFGSTSGGEE